MTWQAALHWAIDNLGELVRDKDGQWHQVSVHSGAPRLRCDMEARPFDPGGEPYSVDESTMRAVELKIKISIQKNMESRGGFC